MDELGVLGKIAEKTKERIARAKNARPLSALRSEALYEHPPMSLSKALSVPGPQVSRR